jgi:hypothetical protein
MALLLGGHDPPDMEPRRWASVATLGLLLAGSAALPAQTWAAQPNQLVAPTVSPRGGTTATSFVFSVTYEARDPALSVVAIVGGQTVGLALVSGTTTSGTYRGESQLPAGSWTVTFSADAERGNDPTAPGGTVQVDVPTPTPTPIPAPTAPPAIATPAPTPPPAGPIAPPAATPTPLPGATDSQPPDNEATEPGSSTAPVPSLLEEHVGTPGGAVFSSLPSPAAGAIGSTSPDGPRASSAVMPIMVGGLGLIAVVAASGLWLGARRRRQQPEAAAPSPTEAGPIAPVDKGGPRPSAVWELDAQLEDATIGTVDYLPLDDVEAVGEPPADLAAAPPPKRVSPRVARLEAARSKRPASTRRSIVDGG